MVINAIIVVVVAMNVLALFYFAFRFVTPSLFLLFPIAMLVFRADDQTLLTSILYLALAWYVLILDIYCKNSLKDVVITKQDNPSLKRYVIFLCLLFALLFIQGLGGVVGANKVGGASPLFGLYTSIYSVCYVFLFVLFVQNKLNKFQIITFVFFILLFGFAMNSRGTIGKGVLLLILVYLFSAAKPAAIIKRAVPVFLYALVPFLSIMVATLYRKGITISPDQLSIGFTFFVEQMQDVRGNMVNPAKIQHLIAFTEDSGYRLDIMYVFAFLYGLVPSFIWSAKPPVSIGQPIGEDVFGSRLGAVGGGVPTDIIGQGVLTFGVEYGLLFGISFSLIFLAGLSFAFKKFKLIGLAAYVSFSSFFGSDFGRMFIDFVYFIPIYLLAYLFLHVRLKFK